MRVHTAHQPLSLSLPVRLLLGLGFSALCLIAGYVAATGSLVLLGILVAAILGFALLFRPTLIVYIVLTLGLLVAGLVPLFFEGIAAKFVWGISGLGMLLAAAAVLQPLINRAQAGATPVFVWLALGFVLYSAIVSVAQLSPPDEVIGGFKRYFQAIGLLFAGAWIAIDEKTMRSWRSIFLVVAASQLPWAVYQLIAIVPYRTSVRAFYPGMIPIDAVAGTFGASRHSGGSNGEMAGFLLFILAFFLSRLKFGLLKKIHLLWLIPLMAPLFLGETKVVVVLLPLLFVSIYAQEIIRRPLLVFGGAVFFSAMTAAVLFTYATMVGRPIQHQIEDAIKYNLGTVGYGSQTLNRTTAPIFWAERQGLEDPVSPVFGNGLGSAHSATGGHVAKAFPQGYGIDINAISTLLWETGLIGTGLYLAMLVMAWRTAGALSRKSGDALLRADAFAIHACIPIAAFYLIYRVGTLEGLPYQIALYGLLGYLAWIYRTLHRVNAA